MDELAIQALETRRGLPRVPHPIPYQGSKRRLAARILAHTPSEVIRWVEPFAGSGAMSLAAAATGCAGSFLLGDALEPLAAVWRAIVRSPDRLADAYERLWRAAQPDPRRFYDRVRAEFNRDRRPEKLLYLLARCVKNAVRFNPDGAFNQSPDNRRLGVRPERMRAEIEGASRLLRGRTEVHSGDYAALLSRVTPSDLVYLDPPYEGTSSGRDRRYWMGLDRARFVKELESLSARGVPYLVSLDGRCGERVYGTPLPSSLGLRRIELRAGPSTQATLVGRRELTVECLYVSPHVGSAPPRGATLEELAPRERHHGRSLP